VHQEVKPLSPVALRFIVKHETVQKILRQRPKENSREETASFVMA
jgi:hypothetical protein